MATDNSSFNPGHSLVEIFNQSLKPMNNIHPEYDELRAVGKDLNSELFRELKKDEYIIAARHLGAMKNNKMMFESDEQFDQYTDFCINDYVDRNGENAVKRYLRQHSDTISTTEERILHGLLSSKSSFFQIVGRDPDTCTVQMQDLLNGGELTITDRGFSASPGATSFMLFSRILSYGDDLHITSGAPMFFPNKSREIVLSRFWRIVKKTPTGTVRSKLYAAFYKLHNRYGYKETTHDEREQA